MTAATAPGSVSAPATAEAAVAGPTIALTAQEQELFQLLRDVAAAWTRAHPEHAEPLTLRVAGGWVRDKVLGLPSDDIDICVNHVSGYDLALLVQAHLRTSGGVATSVGKIKANPEKSKNLETATTRVLGFDVDFAHLRKEQYDAQSRIPVVAFGTPLEDAERRDISINALFYNLHTHAVEDLTGKGLADLAARRIRTPLEPRQTLHEDPLRALRIIRFAARFHCTIDDGITTAMRDPAFQSLFRVKVSRERVGVELTKIQSRGLHDVALACNAFVHAGLFEVVTADRVPSPDTADAAAAHARAVQRLMADLAQLVAMAPPTGDASAATATATAPAADADADAAVVAMLAEHYRCATHYPAVPAAAAAAASDRLRDPPRGLAELYAVFNFALYLAPVTGPWAAPVVPSREQEDAFKAIPKAHWKLPNTAVQGMSDLVSGLGRARAWVAQHGTPCSAEPSRCAVGGLVRELGMTSLKAAWPLVLVLYHLFLCQHPDRVDERRGLTQLVQRVVAEDLADAWQLKALLNGRELCQLLHIKPGPGIAALLDQVILYQLAHPTADRASVEQYMRELHAKKASS